jgi:MFS family permease
MFSRKQLNIPKDYWIILAGFTILVVQNGVGFYAFGLFFKPMQIEFNWSREVTSMGFTILYLVQAASSIIIGRLADRYGSNRIITLGALATGVGQFYLSQITSLPQYYLGYAVLGLGLVSMGNIPITKAIVDAFHERRGFALGLTSSGMGIGGLVLAPMIGNYLIPNLGWRTAYQFLGILILLAVIPLAQLLKTHQRDSEKKTVSEPAERKEDHKIHKQPTEDWTLKAALQTSTFWLIVIAFFLFNISQGGMIQHLANHLTDIGFAVTLATSVISLIGLGSAIGKFAFGYMSDRLKAKYCTTISFLLGFSAALMLISINPESSTATLWAYGIMMGLCIGGWAPLTSVLIGDSFGTKNYGAISGLLFTFFYTASAIGPTFYGYVFDTTNSYYMAFVSSLVFYLVAIVFILATKRPKRTRNLSNDEAGARS